MRTFEKWDQLENMNCRVIINHKLFDDQVYDCDMLQIINTEHRIGVVIKGRELFIHKHKVKNFITQNNVYMVEDDMMNMIIVNKL